MIYASERELLVHCLSGRREALEVFVRQYSDLVYRTTQHTFKIRCAPYTRSDLEDLHNTVFLRLLEKSCRRLRQYEGRNGCKLSSWISIITVRTVLDHLRKEGRDPLNQKKSAVPFEEEEDLRSDDPEPLMHMEKAHQWSLIQEAMKALLPKDRLFIKLHFLEGLSLRDAADILGVSENNIHSLKHRAVARLKSRMAAIQGKKTSVHARNP